MSDELTDPEERSVQLRQRLWGAAVLIAVLVIVLPLILDGSGSESQYRRVERLREEPPRILDAAGAPQAEPELAAPPETAEPEGVEIYVGDDPPPGYYNSADGSDTASSTPAEGLTAWVVQAGSFSEQSNAFAVRDRLRRAGFPSFVSPADDGRPLFRVRVGPMIDAFRAAATRDAVVALLGRDAIVVKYP